jgi:4-hydroxymandelate oxidase
MRQPAALAYEAFDAPARRQVSSEVGRIDIRFLSCVHDPTPTGLSPSRITFALYALALHIICKVSINLKEDGTNMDYRELVAAAETNLKAKNILTNYSVGEGTYLRQGAETNYVNRFNLQYFEHFGFKFRLIDSQEASTETTVFNHKFRTPIFSAAVAGMNDIAEKPLVKIASGVRDSGSMMWLGIVTSEQLKEVVDTGAPTVRIVKPFRDTEAMIKALKEAEEVGAIAVGTDIDFFYGGKRGDKEPAPKNVGPKSLEELKMLAQVTKLPFILKGVLSAEDAAKALDIGAGGIVVSNHAGIVIDYAAHPLEVLPEIKKVIGNRMR